MNDLKITATEFIQRAENGGSPLDNESAHDLKIGHGTPLILMPKRQFVALLKRCLAAVDLSTERQFAEELTALIRGHDQFITRVDPKEIYDAPHDD